MSKLVVKSLVGSLVLLSTTAFADTPNYFNGFYVGAHGGIADAIFQQEGSSNLLLKTNPNENYDFANLNVNKTGDVSSTLGFGGIQAGYGKHFDKFYFGGQFFASFGEASATSTGQLTITNSERLFDGSLISEQSSNSINISSKVDSSYGFSLTPGYLVTPDTLIYAEVGIVQSRVSFDTTASFQESFNVDKIKPVPVVATGSDSKTLTGYRLGVGVEKYLTRNLTLLGSYTFSDYGNFTVNADRSGKILGDPALVTSSAKTSLKTHAFLVGLNYRFS